MIMQNRQNIFFISAIVLLAMIALIEGVVLLRNSPRWQDWTDPVSRTLSAWTGALKHHRPQAENALREKKEKEDIILQETAEDLERMQNQINRLFYEMTGDPAFHRHDPRSPFENTRLGEAWVRRLQSEIGRIFQSAHESRHNGALSLLEQDWRNVNEVSSINLDENRTNYVVAVSLPGFEKADINVSLNGRILTVEAGREQQQTSQNSHATSTGRFKTQIMLPDNIAGEAAQAAYENSILKITIPKKPAGNSLARQVTIM